jgi:hypothetical protein
MFTLRTLFLVIAGIALFCGGWAGARQYYSRESGYYRAELDVLRGEDKAHRVAVARLRSSVRSLEREIVTHKLHIEQLTLALKMCESR